MMKKLGWLFLLLLPGVLGAQGFNGDTGCDCFKKKKGKKIPFYLGLNAGYFQQSYDPQITVNKPLGAPYGGIVAGVHATSFLSVQSGINYTYTASVDNNLVGAAQAEPSPTVSIHYIEIPIELQLRLVVYRNWTVYLQPGVYNNITFLKQYPADLNISAGKKISYNHLYGGGALGGGYILKKNWMVFGQLDYHTMLLEQEYVQPDFKSRIGARLGLTYTFRKK